MEIHGRNPKKRDRQAGEKALDLPARSRFGEGRTQPFTYGTRGLRDHERIDLLVATTMTSNLKCAHSKALESACLFRFPYLRSITTQSLMEESFVVTSAEFPYPRTQRTR